MKAIAKQNPASAIMSVVARSAMVSGPVHASTGTSARLFSAPMYGCVIQGSGRPSTYTLRAPGTSGGVGSACRNQSAGSAMDHLVAQQTPARRGGRPEDERSTHERHRDRDESRALFVHGRPATLSLTLRGRQARSRARMTQKTPREADAVAGLYAREIRTLSGAPLETDACFVCGAKRARPRYAVEGVAAQLVVCEGCGLGRFHPVLGAQEIRAFYPDEYYGEPGAKFQPLVERFVRLVGARHIGFLSRGLAPGARVLDVGCGRGVVLGRSQTAASRCTASR